MTIKVYSKPNCVQCTATYRALENAGLDYQVVDVTTNADAYELVTQLGYLQVPVVVHGEDHWSGFQPDKIRQLQVQIRTTAEEALRDVMQNSMLNSDQP